MYIYREITVWFSNN